MRGVEEKEMKTEGGDWGSNLKNKVEAGNWAGEGWRGGVGR